MHEFPKRIDSYYARVGTILSLHLHRIRSIYGEDIWARDLGLCIGQYLGLPDSHTPSDQRASIKFQPLLPLVSEAQADPILADKFRAAATFALIRSGSTPARE